MKTVRSALSVAIFALLAIGYLASQYAYFTGAPSEYAAKLDRPEITRLALVFLVVAFALMWLPDSKEAKDTDA